MALRFVGCGLDVAVRAFVRAFVFGVAVRAFGPFVLSFPCFRFQ